MDLRRRRWRNWLLVSAVALGGPPIALLGLLALLALALGLGSRFAELG